MLTLVSGPANAAKAGVVFDAYLDAVSDSQNPLLIVPRAADAAHYELELAQQGAVFGGYVLPASALADRIATAVGHSAPRAGPVTKERLIVGALRDISPRALKRSAEAKGFTAAAARFIAEMQAERVSPNQLRSAKPDRVGSELADLLDAYRRRLDDAGLEDRETYFWRALDALRAAPERWGSRPVFLYGFDDLTRLERDAVETLSERAGAQVWVSLAFEPGRAALDARAFSFNELHAIAGEHRALPALEDHYEPASRAALHQLERGLFEAAPPSPAGPGAAVELLEAGGERAEVELIGAWLKARLDEGFEAGELAVVERTPASRASLLAGVLSSYGIPTAIHAERPFAHTTLGRGLISLLRCALEPRQTSADALITWLRTPGKLDHPELADALEAQLRRGPIRGCVAARARWEQAHPRFVLTELDELKEAAERGPRRLIERITHELERLFAAPRKRAAALLADDERIDAHAYAAASQALAELAAVSDRWAPQPDPGEVIELLAALTVRDPAVSAPDRVTVTDPLSVRAQRYRAVVVAGLQEGELPRQEQPDGFLSEDARRALAAAGVPLKPREDPLGDERALFYALASRPTARLALAYRTSDEEGSAVQPSFFLEDVRALYDPPPKIVRRALADVVWPLQTAPSRHERERALAAAGPRTTLAPLETATDPESLRILSDIDSLSPGSLKAIADCGVKWLAERWLRLEALQPEADYLLRGRLIHGALEKTLTNLRERTGSARLDATTSADGAGLFAEAIDELAEEEGLATDDPGVRAMLARLRREGERALAFEAQAPSGWEPSRLELAFGMADSDLAGLALSEELSVHGRIDRVDISPDGERAAIRDYKSRGGLPQARWSDERDLQVALYMLAVRSLLAVDPVAGVYQPLSGRDLRPRGIIVADEGPAGPFNANDAVDRETLEERLGDARDRALQLGHALHEGAIVARPPTCGGSRGCLFPGICRATRT